jgi:hypothetical protein
VSRLRRLLDPRHRPADARPLRPAQGKVRVHFGHRLLLAFPLLHEHLRIPHDPRPGADDRHRPSLRQPRAVHLGGDRRRRRSLDRRKPSDPRHAAEPELQYPARQQSDLRAHQGAILAHVPPRKNHEDHPDGIDRLSDQRALHRDRVRGDLHRAHARHRPSPHGLHHRPRASASGRFVRRNLPELHRVKRQGVRAGHGSIAKTG